MLLVKLKEEKTMLKIKKFNLCSLIRKKFSKNKIKLINDKENKRKIE